MDRLSLLSLLVGGVLPLLVAAVTKASWPEPLKALLLAVFSALTGAGSALLNPSGASYTTVIANAALTFVSAAAVAAGAWKPTGALAKLESVFVRDVVPVVDEFGHAATAGAAASAGDPARTVFTSDTEPGGQ